LLIRIGRYPAVYAHDFVTLVLRSFVGSGVVNALPVLRGVPSFQFI